MGKILTDEICSGNINGTFYSSDLEGMDGFIKPGVFCDKNLQWKIYDYKAENGCILKSIETPVFIGYEQLQSIKSGVNLSNFKPGNDDFLKTYQDTYLPEPVSGFEKIGIGREYEVIQGDTTIEMTPENNDKNNDETCSAKNRYSYFSPFPVGSESGVGEFINPVVKINKSSIKCEKLPQEISGYGTKVIGWFSTYYTGCTKQELLNAPIVGKRNKRETFPWIPDEKENEVLF